jgi:hypothetical protein
MLMFANSTSLTKYKSEEDLGEIMQFLSFIFNLSVTVAVDLEFLFVIKLV